jgi:hypothetical protein
MSHLIGQCPIVIFISLPSGPVKAEVRMRGNLFGPGALQGMRCRAWRRESATRWEAETIDPVRMGAGTLGRALDRYNWSSFSEISRAALRTSRESCSSFSTGRRLVGPAMLIAATTPLSLWMTGAATEETPSHRSSTPMA